MRPFVFERARDAAEAVGQAGVMRIPPDNAQTDAPSQFLAGGTTLVDLMKLDVMRPDRVIDINSLKERHAEILVEGSGLRLGGLAHMADVADHPAVKRD